MRLLKTVAVRKTRTDSRVETGVARVRLHDANIETGCVSWRAPDGREGRGTLSEAAAAFHGALVDVIVPGESILLADAAMPKAGARQLRQAFPFALEDNLAEDVEQLHFALAPRPRGRSAGDPVYGAAVSHALMHYWIEQLHGAGLRIRRLVPDVLCLPLAEADESGVDSEDTGADAPWTLWLEGERFVLRTGRYAGLAAERAMLEPVLAAAGAQGDGEVRRIRVCGTDLAIAEASEHSPIYSLPDIGGVQFEREAEAGECNGSNTLDVERAAGLDLMQAPYRPDAAQTGGLRAWLWPAILVWVLVGANLAYVLIEHIHLATRHAALQHDITVLYHKTFPKDRRIVDARAQMSQHLDALQAAGDGGDKFIELLSALGSAVRAQPTLQVDAVSYRDGRLGVQLSAPRMTMVQNLRESLSRNGRFRTHIESIDAGGDEQSGDKRGTHVRMSIEEKGT